MTVDDIRFSAAYGAQETLFLAFLEHFIYS